MDCGFYGNWTLRRFIRHNACDFKRVESLRSGRVEAVHRIDLEEFLATLGVLDDVNAGNFRCSVCEKVVEVEDIIRIILRRNHPEFICMRCGFHYDRCD